MQKIHTPIKKRLANDRGDMSIFSCFFVMAIVILVSFLLLYAVERQIIISTNNTLLSLPKLKITAGSHLNLTFLPSFSSLSFLYVSD